MPYFTEENLQSLIKASNQYNNTLDTLDDQFPSDPNKLSFAEGASMLRSKGYQSISEDEPDNEFVLNFIFSDPSREKFLDLFDVSEFPDLIAERMAAKQHIHSDEVDFQKESYLTALTQPIKHTGKALWASMSASMPSQLVGNLRIINGQPAKLVKTEKGNEWIADNVVRNMDFKALGKHLWEAMKDGDHLALSSGLRWKDKARREGVTTLSDKIHNLYNEAKIKTEGYKDAPAIAYEPTTRWAQGLEKSLSQWEDLLAARSEEILKELDHDPRHRAVMNGLTNIREKPFFARGLKEHTALFSDAMASMVGTIGTTALTLGITKNPVAAMRVGMGFAFGLESSEQWQQSYRYYKDQGLSPLEASEASHTSALLYGIGAAYIERLPIMAAFPSTVPKGVKLKFYDSLNKGMAKTIKKTKPVRKALGNISVNVGANALEEGLQFAYQSGIHYGFTGEFDSEGFMDELIQNMQAGGYGGVGAVGIGYVGEKFGKDKTVKDKPESPLGREVDANDPFIVMSSVLKGSIDRGQFTDNQNDALASLGTKARKNDQLVVDALKQGGATLINELKSYGVTDEAITDLFDTMDEKTGAEARSIYDSIVVPKVDKTAPDEPVTPPKTPTKAKEEQDLFATPEDFVGPIEGEVVEEDDVVFEPPKQEQQDLFATPDDFVSPVQTEETPVAATPEEVDQFVQQEADDFYEGREGFPVTFTDAEGKEMTGIFIGQVGPDKTLVEVELIKGSPQIVEVDSKLIRPVKETPVVEPMTRVDRMDQILSEDTEYQNLADQEKDIKSQLSQKKNELSNIKEKRIEQEGFLPTAESQAKEAPILEEIKAIEADLSKVRSQKTKIENRVQKEVPIVKGKRDYREEAPAEVDRKQDYIEMVKYPKKGAAEQEYDALKLWYEEGREIVTGSPIGRLPYTPGGLETGKEKRAKIRAAYRPLKNWLNSLPSNKRPKKAFASIVDHEMMLYREEGGIHGEDRTERLKADFFNIGVEPLYFREPGAPSEGPIVNQEDLKEDFQRVASGLPLIKDDPDASKQIVSRLKEQYPEIIGEEVEILTDELGEEVRGKAFANIAQWSKGKATLDTAPHEYAHPFIKALRNDPLIQQAINEFAGTDPKTKKAKTPEQMEEELVQMIGEYYVNKTLKGKPKGFISKFKNFLRKFWVRVKKAFGKPSEYIAEQFFERGEMFQDVKVAPDIKLARQKAINESAMALNELKTDYGIEITRHPTDKTRIGDINVPKKYQKQGIGRKIIDALKLDFRGRNQNVININARPGTEGFWEKMGFKWTGDVVENQEAVSPDTNTSLAPPDEAYKPWVMQYKMSPEEMVFEEPLYQYLTPESQLHRDVVSLINNAFEGMKRETRKKLPVVEFINRMSETLPDRFGFILSSWVDNIKKQYPNLKMETMSEAINSPDGRYYTTPEQFDHAFDAQINELQEGLSDIDPNSYHLAANNGHAYEQIFVSRLGAAINKERFMDLMNDARNLSFEDWVGRPFQMHTKLSYENLSPNKKQIVKRMWVQANSSIRINTGTLKPGRINFIYDNTNKKFYPKGPEHKLTEATNPQSSNKMLYESTGKQLNSNIVWISGSDIFELSESNYKLDQYTYASEWTQMDGLMDEQDFLNLSSAAQNVVYKDDNVNGLVMVGIRGDSNALMFATIQQKHLDIARDGNQLKAYMKNLMQQGLTRDQALQFIGYRKQQDGTFKPTKLASNPKWIAGELARLEAYLDFMPIDMIGKGSELFRRIKIATTPVFTSPAMEQSTIVQYDPNEMVFEDRDGNSTKAMQFIRTTGKENNRADGSSLTSQSFFNRMSKAFGTSGKRLIAKTVIWKQDLSLAVKHQHNRPPLGLKMYKVDKRGNRTLFAEVNNEGNIVLANGTQVDMLMTPDEAKISTHDLYKPVTIEGNEIGLIKYHNKKYPSAAHPMQWYNYVFSKEVRDMFKSKIMPRINRWLNRTYLISDDGQGVPSLVNSFLRSIKSDSPQALTDEMSEKAELGLGLHPDVEPKLNTLIKTKIITPALKASHMDGAYIDVVPDYSGRLKSDEISIAKDDAEKVLRIYAESENIDYDAAKQTPIDMINSWLKDNPVEAIVSRSPISAIGGIFIGKVVELHNRGGQVAINTETGFTRLEYDTDGDALQIEFPDSEVLSVIKDVLESAEKEGRMRGIDMKKYPSTADQYQDLSIKENVSKLSSKFTKGKRAIGEIANVQNIYGQLEAIFDSAIINGDVIKIVPKNMKHNFAATGEQGLTLEQIYRRWLQAAVDNMNFLLLDDWGYSQDKLMRSMFIRQDQEGRNLGKVTDSQWEALKSLIAVHKKPGRIRNGNSYDKQYNLQSILEESVLYLEYVNNRENYIKDKNRAMRRYKSNAGIIQAINFKNETAPLEDVAISLAEGWANHQQRGKLTPIRFEDDIYKAVHMQSVEKLNEDIYDILEKAKDVDNLSEAELLNASKLGRQYAQRMTQDFVKVLSERKSEIGPVSWSMNKDLYDFKRKWNVEFNNLSEMGKVVATIQFLKGTRSFVNQRGATTDTKDKVGLVSSRNRKVLPPFSNKAEETLLHADTMKKYLDIYNKLLMNPDARTQSTGQFIRTDSFETTIKDLCR